MAESKIDLTHRLQREGRWTEASEFRDRVRKERREAGDTRDIANDAAWEAMAEKYPPMPVISLPGKVSTRTSESADDPFSDDDDSALLPETLLPGAATCESDLTWAYQNLCSPVTPDMAPCGAAFALRAWGRSDKGRDKFFAAALKFLAPKDAQNSRSKEDRSRQFALLSRLEAVFAGLEKADSGQRCCPLCDGTFTTEQQAAHARSKTSTPQCATQGTTATQQQGL